MKFRAGKANVLNISAADLEAMGNMSFDGPAPDQNTPLIVNVMDSGRVELDGYPPQGGIGDWVKSTLWNFPRVGDRARERQRRGVRVRRARVSARRTPVTWA